MKYQVWQVVENAWGTDTEVIFETNNLAEAKKVIDEVLHEGLYIDPEDLWIEDDDCNVID